MLIKRQLTTHEIDDALRKNKHTNSLYQGTFPVDLLPRFRPRQPALIVVNTGTSHTDGIHCILLYFPPASSHDRNSCFLFDSMGNSAESNDYLSSFVGRTSPIKYRFNPHQLQHPNSQACGFFVLAVAFLLSIGVKPETLPQHFCSTSLASNDTIISKIVEREFKLTSFDDPGAAGADA